MIDDIRRYINLITENTTPEIWITVSLFGNETHIGWSSIKNQTNQNKHGVGLSLGINVIQDPNMIADPTHEKLNKFIGRSNNIVMVAAIEWLNEHGETSESGEDVPSLRIISVRQADKNETQRYINQNIKEDVLPLIEDNIDADNPPITDFSNFIPANVYWKQKFAKFNKKR